MLALTNRGCILIITLLLKYRKTTIHILIQNFPSFHVNIRKILEYKNFIYVDSCLKSFRIGCKKKRHGVQKVKRYYYLFKFLPRECLKHETREEKLIPDRKYHVHSEMIIQGASPPINFAFSTRDRWQRL